MPSGISAAMLQEVKEHPERVFATFELDLDGTTHKFSDEYVKSNGSGMYLKKVSGWDDFERPAFGSGYNLEGASGGVQIEDDDEVLGKAIGGGARMAMVHAKARGYWRSDSVDHADHYKFFDGRVIDWRIAKSRTYDFELGPDTLCLESEENNIPRISATDWPNAPEKIIASGGSPGQVVYGKHRSAGNAGSAGMVPTVPVDKLNNYWYVSIGKIIQANVITVYRNGDETSDFTVEWILRNGTFYTVLKHTPNTADQESDTVTVDMNGVDGNGDGESGFDVKNPIDGISHFLTNFVFNAYPTGTADGEIWLDVSSAPIDESLFDVAGAFFSNRGYEIARVLKTTDRGIDVLNGFCEEMKVSPFWSSNWTLGILPMEHGKLELNTPRLVRMEDLRGEPQSAPRTGELVNHLSTRYLRDTAANALRQGPIRIVNSKRTPIISKSFDLEWLRASVT